MKVLLLGDYSSLGLTLKEGLQQLGITVNLAANGDGWKNIPGADMYLFPPSDETRGLRYRNYVVFPRRDKRFSGYDIVQCPGTDIFSWRAGLKPFENIIGNNDKFFLNVAGVDYYLYKSWKNKKLKYGYYMFDDNEDLRTWLGGKTISSIMRNIRCREITKKAYGIIPVIPYEYEFSYEGFSNLCRPILLPVNTDKHKSGINKVERKIVYFHGINRIKDKGSEYIKAAMLRAQEKYPNDIECIIAERMPYDEYVRALERANVVIDQCKSYGYGMNACIAMAKGKIVFSGAEDAVVSKISTSSCPVINIRPDVEQIYSQIIAIIEGRNKITDMGMKSREYVVKYHNYVDIAKQYLEAWNK